MTNRIDGRTAHLAQGTLLDEDWSLLVGRELDPLLEHTDEDMGKDEPFRRVGVVCQSQTVLHTAFRIGADEEGEAVDQELADLAFTLLYADLSTRSDMASKLEERNPTLENDDFSEIPSSLG